MQHPIRVDGYRGYNGTSNRRRKSPGARPGSREELWSQQLPRRSKVVDSWGGPKRHQTWRAFADGRPVL